MVAGQARDREGVPPSLRSMAILAMALLATALLAWLDLLWLQLLWLLTPYGGHARG